MTFAAKIMQFYANSVITLPVDNRETSPATIRVCVTLLSQMFLYLDSLNVDTDAFLRSLGVGPAL